MTITEQQNHSYERHGSNPTAGVTNLFKTEGYFLNTNQCQGLQVSYTLLKLKICSIDF